MSHRDHFVIPEFWVRYPWTVPIGPKYFWVQCSPRFSRLISYSSPRISFGPRIPGWDRTNLELIFVRESIIAFQAHVVKFPRGIGPGISREIPDLLKGVSTVFTRVHGDILPCYRHVRRTFSVFNNWILKGMGHPKSSPKSLGE